MIVPTECGCEESSITTAHGCRHTLYRGTDGGTTPRPRRISEVVEEHRLSVSSRVITQPEVNKRGEREGGRVITYTKRGAFPISTAKTLVCFVPCPTNLIAVCRILVSSNILAAAAASAPRFVCDIVLRSIRPSLLLLLLLPSALVAVGRNRSSPPITVISTSVHFDLSNTPASAFANAASSRDCSFL